jgi:DNA-binding transcriptional ArsR family regulator
LVILTDRTASPKELAEALNEPDISNVAYHVKVLRDLGKIELVDTAQRRGATEHFYRAVERPFLTAEEHEELSPDERRDWLESIFQDIVIDAEAAFEARTFEQRPEMCLNRYPTQLDEQGFGELSKILEEAQSRAFEVQAACDERVSKDPDAETIPSRFVCALFEMPGLSTRR